MIEELWTTVIVRPQSKDGYNAPGSSFGNPVALQTTRALYEGPFQKQVEQAQEIFDAALTMIVAGEEPKLVTESVWKRVSHQATEPARKEKVRLYSERRRTAAAEMKRRRAEEREERKAAKAAKEQAESNGHGPAEVTDEDLRDAAVEEESLALALADTHEPAGSGADDGDE